MTAPILMKLWRAGRVLLLVAGLLVAIALVMEGVRIFVVLHRMHPAVAYSFLAFVLLLTGIVAARIGARWLSAHVLVPPTGPEDGARSHHELITFNRFLVQRLKLLYLNPLFTEEQQKHLRQEAYQLDELLGHHPLHDDLVRSHENIRKVTLAPAHALLRARAEAMARERMRKVVNDAIQPPFPTHPLITAYGHQFIMASRIVDLYVPDAGLMEYARVLGDTCRVVTAGRFLKLGQTLFAGVYRNSPPLGRTAETLGEALSLIWLTRTVSMACMLRCEDLRCWSTPRAVADLDACVLGLLADSKECLMQDALPVLKLAIRHNAPTGVTDVTSFSSTVIEGLARAVDAAVTAHKAQPPEAAVAAARRTIAGDQASLPPSPEPEPSGRRRHHRNRHGLSRVLHVFGQRLKYSLKRPR